MHRTTNGLEKRDKIECEHEYKKISLNQIDILTKILVKFRKFHQLNHIKSPFSPYFSDLLNFEKLINFWNFNLEPFLSDQISRKCWFSMN